MVISGAGLRESGHVVNTPVPLRQHEAYPVDIDRHHTSNTGQQMRETNLRHLPAGLVVIFRPRCNIRIMGNTPMALPGEAIIRNHVCPRIETASAALRSGQPSLDGRRSPHLSPRLHACLNQVSAKGFS